MQNPGKRSQICERQQKLVEFTILQISHFIRQISGSQGLRVVKSVSCTLGFQSCCYSNLSEVTQLSEKEARGMGNGRACNYLIALSLTK